MSWGNTVRAKLVVAVVVLVGAIVLFQVVYFPNRQARSMERALALKGEAVARVVAHDVAPALEFQDKALVEEVFRGLTTDPDVVYVALYDATGALVTAVDAERRLPGRSAGAARHVSELRGDVLHVEAPSQPKSGDPGAFVVGFSDRSIRAEVASNWYATLGAGGVVFLGGLLGAIGLASAIGNPMRELARVAGAVADGRLDLQVPDVRSADEIGQMARAFGRMITSLRELEQHVMAVARGDLTQDISVSGDLAEAFQEMVVSQRGLVTQIVETSADIRVSSTQILATSRELEQTANEQAAVVEETLRTMESLLESANQIAESAQAVLGNAERTYANSQMIAERITALAGHTQRIGGFLEVIKEIANKTDLLALNAALEGTRAGEAGRGFSLVASQMQRLTVNVMDAVSDIKGLTSDIREATSASVLATEDATKRALSTEQSARQINLIIRQQQSGTEQVSQSMGEISSAIRQSVAASAHSAESAAQLEQLSERLQERVNQFRLSERP